MNNLLRRLEYWLRRRRLEADLEEELEFHRAMKERALEESGIPAEEARYASRRALGNTTLAREDARGVWIAPWIEQFWIDIRNGVRMLQRTRGFTATVVISLALGIGANTALFSVFNAIYIRDLEVEKPEELVVLAHINTDGSHNNWSVPFFEEFRRRQVSFEGLFATCGLCVPLPSLDPGGVEVLERFNGSAVSASFFQVLGVPAAAGRVITDEDDQFPAANPVAVISDKAWRQRFGGHPSVLGRRIYVFGHAFTIIGVMPEGFGVDGEDFWVPLNTQPIVQPGFDMRRNPGGKWLGLMGRLKENISLGQAQAEADVLYPQLAAERKIILSLGQKANLRLELGSRGFGNVQRVFGRPLQVLMGAVAVLLLIVSANVASLLLARASSREREIAVRQALGCGRGRLVRQFFVESLILAACGGAIGLAIAPASAAGLLAVAQPNGLALDISLDANVLVFTLAVSFIVAMVFGLAPALRASNIASDAALKSASRTASKPSRGVLNRCFVAVQVALSVVLVAGSVLFGQSLYRLYSTDTGFDGTNVLNVALLRLPSDVNASVLDAQYTVLAQRLNERLSAVPGVKSVSFASCGIMVRCSGNVATTIEGSQVSAEVLRLRVNSVSNNFFQTLAIPIVEGRGFRPDDRLGSPEIAVVNQTFARTHFPGQSVIGKRFWTDPRNPVEIVGVVKDSKYNQLREAAVPLAFRPFEQGAGIGLNYIQLKTGGSSAAFLGQLRAAITEIDPRLRPVEMQTLDEAVDRSIYQDILLTRLSGLFGTLALFLACFGVYGVISYLVAARTAEIGIRLALGAEPRNVRREVIASAIKTVAPGVAGGIVIAVVAERFVEPLLFGATGRDPVTYAFIAAGLLLSTALAAYVPARRASGIDPVSALRCE